MLVLYRPDSRRRLLSPLLVAAAITSRRSECSVTLVTGRTGHLHRWPEFRDGALTRPATGQECRTTLGSFGAIGYIDCVGFGCARNECRLDRGDQQLWNTIHDLFSPGNG